jgi:hypothetical protein
MAKHPTPCRIRGIVVAFVTALLLSPQVSLAAGPACPVSPHPHPHPVTIPAPHYGEGLLAPHHGEGLLAPHHGCLHRITERGCLRPITEWVSSPLLCPI